MACANEIIALETAADPPRPKRAPSPLRSVDALGRTRDTVGDRETKRLRYESALDNRAMRAGLVWALRELVRTGHETEAQQLARHIDRFWGGLSNEDRKLLRWSGNCERERIATDPLVTQEVESPCE